MRKGARGKAPHAPNESQLQPKRRSARTPRWDRPPPKHAKRAALLFSFNPRRTRAKGTDESHRAIDYPVFCNPAETPVTVERIRLMYSAFASSES